MLLLLSTVGIVGCVAGIIGSWWFRQYASERVQKISARLAVGLRRPSAATQTVQRGVGKARADLALVGKESADLGGGGEKSRRAARSLRKLIQQKAGPNFNDLGGRLATLSDAAVAVSPLIQSFQELPLSRTGRLKPDQLDRWADATKQFSATLRRLEVVVGDGDKETNGGDVAAATNEVDLVLQNCQATLKDWQSDLDAAREQLPQLQAEILGWLTLAAIVVTVLGVWVAVGQISLFAHAWKWVRVA
jgi:hypothetical protein